MGQEIRELLTPPRRSRLGDKIVADIKRLIFSDQIEPGQKLPSERELAGLLRVSRVVVREALRTLEHSGLVEISGSPAAGAVVTHNLYKPMAGSMSDLYKGGQLTLRHFVEVRRAIECSLIRLAAERAAPSDLEALAAINRKLYEEAEDRGKLRHSNMAFHVAAAQIAGNPLGVLIVRSLLELLDTLRPKSVQSPDFARDTFGRHEALLAALKDGDAERSSEIMDLDVKQTGELVED